MLLRGLSKYRFTAALLVSGVFEQGIISVTRISTSYRAVELELSWFWVGVITASYALAPIFLAIPAGRYVDKGNDARLCWIGSATLLAACAGFVLTDGWLGLLIFTILLGNAHLLLYIGLQVLCARDDTPGAMERTFGNFMVANAIGQGLGSYVVAKLGGTSSVAPTDLLFQISFAAAAIAFLITLFIRPVPAKARASKEMPRASIADILRVPGFVSLFMVSVVSVLAQDLLVVYLPLLGAERSIPVDAIGQMLTVRAFASMAARLLFSRLHRMLGGDRLLILSTVAGAAGYLAIVLPLPVWALFAAIVCTGFSLGIAITVAISSSMSLMTVETRGTATSLRMVGNRLAQLFVPLVVGVLAAFTGAAGIFAILGTGLAVSATARQMRGKADR